MNKKMMSIIYGSKKETDHYVFQRIVNGEKYYEEKHDAKMKKLFDTGKIKEYIPTSELFRLKKEAEKAKKQRRPIK